MHNLRDKLLKAGLVTEDQAKRVDSPKQAPARSPVLRADPAPAPAPAPARARPDVRRAAPVREAPVPKLPPLPGSKAFQREEAARQRELDLKLRELVLENQVPVEPGERTFYFVTRKGRLRRLELSDAQAQALEQGQLAVVERQEPAQIEHSLVPASTAEAMLGLFVKSVRFFNRPGAAVGFLNDEQLKEHQDQEARLGPEEPDAPATPTPGTEPPAADAVPPPASRASEPETWISIRRSASTTR